MSFGHAAQPTRKNTYFVREFLRGSRPRDAQGNKLPRQRFEYHKETVDQMFYANRFQNELVKIELDRRAAREEAINAASPQLAQQVLDATAIQEEMARIRTTIAERNVDTQMKLSRRIKLPEQFRDHDGNVRFSDLTDQQLLILIRNREKDLKTAWQKVKATRAATVSLQTTKDRLEDIDSHYTSLKDAARNQAVRDGLHWPTSLQVMQRVKRSGPAPRFKRFTGENTISVQFQRKPDAASPKVPVLDNKGNPRIHGRSGKPMMRHERGGSISTTGIFRPNTICWLEKQPWQVGMSTHNDFHWCHFRINSKGDMAKLPVVLHHPLPEDAEVKWVHLSRREVGSSWRWEVHFDVARPEWDDHPHPEQRADEGIVAVALGWRKIGPEIRVGEWIGDDGVTGTIRLPDYLTEQWMFLEKLQSNLKREFDVCKDGVVTWLKTQQSLSPEWERRTASIAQWNSPKRLMRLITWWRFNRIPGDDAVFDAAEGRIIQAPRTTSRNYGHHHLKSSRDYYTGGRKQMKHLLETMGHLRNRLTKARNDFHRIIALDLSYQYRSVAIAEIDWREIAENPSVDSTEEKVSKRFKGLAACATLRNMLTHYMTGTEVDPEYITQDCCRCGNRMEPPGRGQWVQCEQCNDGKRDRAVNAAKNILQKALGSGGTVPTARV